LEGAIIVARWRNNFPGGFIMRLWSLIALLPALAACASAGPELAAFDAASLRGSAWVQGTDSGARRLEFNSAGQASGTGGCNNFSAPVEMNSQTLKFGPIRATKKRCDSSVQAVEDAFFRALEAAASARWDRGQLVLLDSRSAPVLRLDRDARSPGAQRP
jgi:heat shock protein HslJ